MKLSLKKPSFSIPHHWLVPNWQQEFSERRLLMLAVAVLACLGVTIVGSASMSIASSDFNDPFYFFRRPSNKRLQYLKLSSFNKTSVWYMWSATQISKITL